MEEQNQKQSELSAERAPLGLFLEQWRDQLLIHEAEGDAEAIECDRRILDYYLDQYNRCVTPPDALFPARTLAAKKEPTAILVAI